MSSPKERIYTIDNIYALPDGERAELIDGQIYYMESPLDAIKDKSEAASGNSKLY